MSSTQPPGPQCSDSRDRLPDQVAGFSDVFGVERKAIEASRRVRGEPSLQQRGPVGLAFSGGGIRSATFNLGVLQALADRGLLSRFDYLSTVSGGGYIGSWLAALTLREGGRVRTVEQSLAGHAYAPGSPAEIPAIRFLRNYSNYLTPRVGLLSGDTWAAFGTWGRNVLLNLAILLLLAAAGVLLSYWLPYELLRVAGAHPGRLVVLLLIVLLGAIAGMWFSMTTRGLSQQQRKRNIVSVTVLVPLFLVAVIFNTLVWVHISSLATWSLSHWLGIAIGYAVIWAFVLAVSARKTPSGLQLSRLALFAGAAVAGVAVGALVYSYLQILSRLPHGNGVDLAVTAWGSAAVVTIMLLAGVVQLGITGTGCSDLVREWWARLGGFMTLSGLIWIGVFAITLLAPVGVHIASLKSRDWVLPSGTLFWIVTTILGTLSAKSARTNGTAGQTRAAKPPDLPGAADRMSRLLSLLTSPAVLKVLARLAPYVFVLGTLIGVSTAVFSTAAVLDRGNLHTLWTTGNRITIWTNYSSTLKDIAQWPWLLPCILALGGAALVLSNRVEINEFSLHNFYRNRLTRCYLGATSPQRHPQPFTGFDPADDLPLADLAGSNYDGPLPVLNATLNAVQGAELAFAKRKAKSFVFTPHYSGYEGCYRPSVYAQVGKNPAGRGISLGTAMAISGAALSPNAGVYTAPATAFLLTLFNVRLGWWLGTPRDPGAWRRKGPWSSLGCLMTELSGQSSAQSKYIYLSDGGHFENLGIYELVKRRCSLIIVSDAAHDPRYGFDDLMNAIEKCRADFGVEIRINPALMHPSPDARELQSNVATGTICYGDAEPGLLVYLKSGLPRNWKDSGGSGQGSPCAEETLPRDVVSYAEAHPAFPHDSTADQWFDELQFENYRTLGHYLGGDAAAAMGAWPGWQERA